ncbi:DUF3558 family protein [Aeromicrobium sp.]|uniref:DUF3558 family protein n=1 Tax=Aeromicrobium sp. TaxID=1871063 RepID=UPI0030BA3A37
MRRSIVTLIVGLVCTLGACGGGGDESDSGSTSDSSSSSSKDDADSGESFDPCSVITAAEAEKVLGYPVIQEEDPAGGCSWRNEDDPRKATFSVTKGMPADQGGGIESAKAGTQSVLEGEPQEVPGVGDTSFLVVGKGKSFAKEAFQAQGVIEAGGQLITVGITQLGEASEDEVTEQATAGMKLVGSKV